MAETKIQWTDVTWNPITGCTQVSAGCRNCYAKRMAERLSRIPGSGYCDTGEPFSVRFHRDRLDHPQKWKKPRRVFVCSMGDLWHPDVDPCDRAAVMRATNLAPQHTYIFLTKRPERIVEDFSGCPNFWIGTSVETQAMADLRIPHLLRVPAAVRFLSCEPLLGPIDLEILPCRACNHPGNVLQWPCPHCRGRRFEWPDWVIAGGESGVGARPCKFAWLRDIRDQCRQAGVPYFIKQLGSNPHGEWIFGEPPHHCLTQLRNGEWRNSQELSCCKNGKWKLRDRKGGSMSEWPEDLRIRQFPGGDP